jgi:hypothetical protein
MPIHVAMVYQTVSFWRFGIRRNKNVRFFDLPASNVERNKLPGWYAPL